MQILRSIFTLMLFSVLIMSCAEKSDKTSSEPTNEVNTTETQTTNTPEAPAQNKIQLQNSTVNTGTSINTTTPAGINPPHGQPGHDCKVPVGQPLNGSTLNTTNSVTPQGGPRINNIPQPAAPVTQTAPGMNPPHGQPGHDCKIQVGKPLNVSK